MNTIRQIKLILYRLKRDFGEPVNIITKGTITQNVTTGIINAVERLIRVKRAVVIDAKSSRDFVYDLSFIAANKNFTYGGLFDTASRDMIIDGIDLPKDYEPSLDDRVIIAGQRYQFKKIEITSHELAYRITLQHLEAQRTEAIEELSTGQVASLDQEATNA